MVGQQAALDKWFLRQDVMNQLLASGEASIDATQFADRILAIAETEMEGLGIDRDEIDVILDDMKSGDYNYLLKAMDEHLGANEDYPFGIIFETTNEELLNA